jgi:hypothetical protein
MMPREWRQLEQAVATGLAIIGSSEGKRLEKNLLRLCQTSLNKGDFDGDTNLDSSSGNNPIKTVTFSFLSNDRRYRHENGDLILQSGEFADFCNPAGCLDHGHQLSLNRPAATGR